MQCLKVSGVVRPIHDGSLGIKRLTVICCGTSSLWNQSNHNSLKPLHSNNKFYTPCSTPWSVDTQLLLLHIIPETNNYTKSILPSHTDHSPNSRATNCKKITTEELNRSIACHRPRQTKNKSHMLVHKTHHSIVLGSITFPRDNFN